MIYFCEINKTGREHASINRILLLLLTKAFQQYEVKCWVSSAHWDEMESSGVILDHIEPKFVNVLAPIPSDKIRWVRKLIRECRFILNIFINTRRDRPRLIFFSSLSPTGNLFCGFLNKLFFSKQQVVITLHGELQLLWKRPTKKIDQLYAGCLRKSFNLSIKRRKFLVLDELIETYLVANKLVRGTSIVSIPHPCRFPEVEKQRVVYEGRKVVFGHIGVAKLSKRSHLFFQLAQYFNKEIEEGLTSFVLAGPVLANVSHWKNTYVEYANDEDFVRNEEFANRCQMMTYAIFMYDDSEYELVSSGAIIDAVSFEIPILAIRNKQVEHLFGKCQTAPGMIFDSFEEMRHIMAGLITSGDGYEKMKAGIKELKKYYGIAHVQQEFSRHMHMMEEHNG